MTKRQRQNLYDGFVTDSIDWDNWTDDDSGKYMRVAGVLSSRLEWLDEGIENLTPWHRQVLDLARLYLEAHDGLLSEPQSIPAGRQTMAERKSKMGQIVRAIGPARWDHWNKISEDAHSKDYPNVSEVLAGELQYLAGEQDISDEDDDTMEHADTIALVQRYMEIHSGMLGE